MPVREDCTQLKLAAHRLNVAAQRREIQIRLVLDTADLSLADAQHARQLCLRQPTGISELGKRLAVIFLKAGQLSVGCRGSLRNLRFRQPRPAVGSPGTMTGHGSNPSSRSSAR